MFIHEKVEKLWRDIQWFIEPHKKAAKAVLEKLDSEEGDISSIALSNISKSPYVTVNVRDHTIGVVREAMELDEPRMTTYQLLVLAALGHDVGKLPCGNLDRDPKTYKQRMHAEASARLCRQWFTPFLLPDHPSHLKRVLEAIEEHHDGLDDDETVKQLAIADQKARDNELMTMTPDDLRGLKMISFGHDAPGPDEPKAGLQRTKTFDPDSERLPFFTVPEFLKRLEPELNSKGAYTHLGYEAFTMSARTYVTTYRVFKVIREWAHEVGYGKEIEEIADYNAYPGRWDNLIAHVGGKLREAGALVEKDLPGAHYTHRKFVVTDGHGKNRGKERMFYMPFKTKVFPKGVRALENLKKGSLFEDIVKVQPDFGVWAKKKEAVNG